MEDTADASRLPTIQEDHARYLEPRARATLGGHNGHNGEHSGISAGTYNCNNDGRLPVPQPRLVIGPLAHIFSQPTPVGAAPQQSVHFSKMPPNTTAAWPTPAENA